MQPAGHTAGRVAVAPRQRCTSTAAWHRFGAHLPMSPLTSTPTLPPHLAVHCRSYEGRWVREYVDATVPEMAFGEFWDTCSYSGEGSSFT